MHGVVQAESRLGDSLAAVLQAQKAVQTPNCWVVIIQDVGLVDGVFCCFQFAKLNQGHAQVNPASGRRTLFADFAEDCLRILPRLASSVDYTKTQLKNVVCNSGLYSERFDVRLFAVKKVVLKEKGVSSQNPSFLVTRVFFK